MPSKAVMKVTSNPVNKSRFPLYVWFRQMRWNHKGKSKINLLRDESFRSVYQMPPQIEVCDEMLRRFVRRYPEKILACDIETKDYFRRRYAPGSRRELGKQGFGFLRVTKVPWEQTVCDYPSHVAADAFREWYWKVKDTPRWKKMDNQQKAASILIKQIGVAQYGNKTRIQRQKNNTTERLA